MKLGNNIDTHMLLWRKKDLDMNTKYDYSYSNKNVKGTKQTFTVYQEEKYYPDICQNDDYMFML